MIDTEQPAVVPQHNVNLVHTKSLTRQPLFPTLDSKLGMSTVLGYAFTWEQLQKFFNLISKKGRNYFMTNQAQLRQFVNDKTIDQINLAFGNRSFQFIRPKMHARIGQLDFAYITCDLYTIENFAHQTLQIDKLMFGNRGFKLFENAKLDEMVGL